jgi:hypothetical protein
MEEVVFFAEHEDLDIASVLFCRSFLLGNGLEDVSVKFLSFCPSLPPPFSEHCVLSIKNHVLSALSKQYWNWSYPIVRDDHQTWFHHVRTWAAGPDLTCENQTPISLRLFLVCLNQVTMPDGQWCPNIDLAALHFQEHVRYIQFVCHARSVFDCA